MLSIKTRDRRISSVLVCLSIVLLLLKVATLGWNSFTREILLEVKSVC